MARISIRTEDPTHPDAKALLLASHRLMQGLFPSDANHFLSVDALRAPHITFFVAKTDVGTAGCAALANLVEYGEVKSMYVDPDARGAGVAVSLMTRLFEEARAQELKCLRLETGTGLDAAHRLYARFGFVDCPAFGDYQADAPYSRYLEREL